VQVPCEYGPASSLEEEWFRATPDGLSNFSLPLVLRIDGPLDHTAVRQALTAMSRRHEALRTGFRMKGPDVERIVLGRCTPSLAVIDMSHVSDPQRAVERLVLSESGQMTDLTQPPLWRALLVKIAQDTHLAVFIFHHAVFDGWSGAVFRRDFTRLYKAALAKADPRLPDLPVTLGQYAEWERSKVRSADPAGYWREQPPRRPQALPLHAAAGQSVMAGQAYRTIAPEHVSAIRDAAARHGTTIANGMRAAALASLAPYLGDGVTVGFLMSARLPETKSMIGVFADHTIVRLDLGDDPTFGQLLARVAESTVRARRFAPPSGLIRCLSPDDRSVDVSLNYLPAQGREVPARVSADPAADISVVSTPMDAVRPRGRLGFPGVVPVAYMVRHDGDGAVRGEVVGCAHGWGSPAGPGLAVINGLALQFTSTAERIAVRPDGRIGQLSRDEP
jgi:hypothetical protein